MRNVVRRILLVLPVLLLQGVSARAVVFEPGQAPAPEPPPAALESARTQQQATAPAIPGEQPPNRAPVQTSRRAASSAHSGAADAAFAAGATSSTGDPEKTAGGPDPARNRARGRGLALMIAGGAGIAGLIFGRLGFNVLSKSNAREAAEATRPTAVRDDGSRTYGGEHRSYLIDTDEDA